jgi:hypothetical protein
MTVDVEIIIETDIPCPMQATKEKTRVNYGIVRQLNVGDSVFYPNRRRGQVVSGINYWQTGFKFVFKPMDRGVRVWRVA